VRSFLAGFSELCHCPTGSAPTLRSMSCNQQMSCKAAKVPNIHNQACEPVPIKLRAAVAFVSTLRMCRNTAVHNTTNWLQHTGATCLHQ
jgi:hypothetical protein